MTIYVMLGNLKSATEKFGSIEERDVKAKRSLNRWGGK